MSRQGFMSRTSTSPPGGAHTRGVGEPDEPAWASAPGLEYGVAMQLQQAYGNAYVARKYGGRSQSAVAAAPVPDEDQEPTAPALEVEEEQPMAPGPDEDEEPVPGQSSSQALTEPTGQQAAGQQAILDKGNSGEQPAPEVSGGEISVQEDFVPDEGQPVNHEDLPIREVIDPQPEEEAPAAAPAPRFRFVDAGMVGTKPVGDYDVDPADERPRAFVNGGNTGTIAWGGGGGAGPHGNEGVGTIQAQVAPLYKSVANPGRNADAWVATGTGTISVTRSFLGAVGGDQANGFWVSPAAAQRLNQHEVQHVNSTRGHYNTNIDPMEKRISDSIITGAFIAPTEPAAITAMQNHVRWAQSIAAFQAADIADNTPMATIDTADLASGTYPQHAGPGNANGKAFTQRLRLPGEAIPP